MTKRKVVLKGPEQRALVRNLIKTAPADTVVTIGPPQRTLDQNAALWAMLADIAAARPEGRTHPPEVWKSIFMQACGYEVQYAEGLDGYPFAVSPHTSLLSASQFRDLLTFIRKTGDEWGVKWSAGTKWETSFLKGNSND